MKQLAAPEGLMILDGGLNPSMPVAFERAGAWAVARDAARVEIQVAYVDTAGTGGEDFVPTLELFTAVELAPAGSPDASGFFRYESELPPRPQNRVLYYFFSAFDDDGFEQRLPAASPEGAVAVGWVPFEIPSPRPDWSLPFEPILCWADASRWNPDFAGAGPNFDEIVDPIWATPQTQTILSSRVGVNEGIGVIIEGQPYFYPLNIMLWNEVANAIQGQTETVMSYCPLTDSAVLFRHENSAKTRIWQTAGLYNSNLIVGDPRPEKSAVPQLLAFGISGSRNMQCAEVLPSFLCDANFWIALHADTRILNGDGKLTGWDWLSLNNPYFSYWRDSGEIRSPIAHVDEEHPLGLGNKSRVVGVIAGDRPTVYAVNRAIPSGVLAYNDDGGTRPMVLFWVQGPSFAGVFDRRLPLTGRTLSFRRAAASFQGTPLFEDDDPEPSLWTVEGLAIAGPLAGMQLAWVPSTRVFWFAWYAMYPDSRVVDVLAAEAE